MNCASLTSRGGPFDSTKQSPGHSSAAKAHSFAIDKRRFEFTGNGHALRERPDVNPAKDVDALLKKVVYPRQLGPAMGQQVGRHKEKQVIKVAETRQD